MTKKQYIEKLENLIINKLRYHAPRFLSEDVNLSVLDAYGINPIYPVFILKKPLNEVFYKAFFSVKKKIKFNLVLMGDVCVCKRKLDKLDLTYVIDRAEFGSEFYNALSQLNINYPSKASFYRGEEEEYLKINGKKIAYDYLPYFYNKKFMDSGVIVEVKCFLLNGKNYYLAITNTRDCPSEIEIDLNIPLPRGYYFFKKGANFVGVKNLTGSNRAYFNYFAPGGEICFSSMDGIESCTFACVHFKSKIKLLAKQTCPLFFNWGEKKFVLTNRKDMQNYFYLSQDKMNEIFDTKVTTRDKLFDELFNFSLPRKIWEKWQNFDFDEKCENEWLKNKGEIVTSTGKGVQVNNDFKGLKEVRFFRNKRWKRVFIVHNGACYMYAGRTKYFNYTTLTKEVFDKNDEICLSFYS